MSRQEDPEESRRRIRSLPKKTGDRFFLLFSLVG